MNKMKHDPLKNLYLLTHADLKKMRKFVRLLESAVVEIAELKRVTTFESDRRESFPPAESDLIEERSFINNQFELFD